MNLKATFLSLKVVILSLRARILSLDVIVLSLEVDSSSIYILDKLFNQAMKNWNYIVICRCMLKRLNVFPRDTTNFVDVIFILYNIMF